MRQIVETEGRPRAPREQQIVDAYRAMAEEAKYRPEIPGDIAGTIEMPEEELGVNREALGHLDRFKRDEEKGFYIGTG
jgi:hypothetical protein